MNQKNLIYIHIIDLGTNPSSEMPALSLLLLSVVSHCPLFYILPSFITPFIKSYMISTIHAFATVLAVCIFYLRSSGNLTQVNRILSGGIKGRKMKLWNIVYVLHRAILSTIYFSLYVSNRLEITQQ